MRSRIIPREPPLRAGWRVSSLQLMLLLALPLSWSCTRGDEDRRATFEEAERVNSEIFRGAVVRDLRAPPDTGGRLVYDTVLSLHQRHAAGAPRVWAPFGIAQPDTTR